MHAPAEESLAALQARMARALLAAAPAAQGLPEAGFAGAHAGAVGLRVHRNTILGALANALRLGHPAVERLVGEAFFDRMAVDFARAAPPRAPQLDEYGAGFAARIDGFPGTEALPYLAELARFEWAVGELGRRCVEPAGVVLTLEGGARLRLAAPLRTFASPWPVDVIRTAILGDDIDALRALQPGRGTHDHALWRVAEGVSVRALRAPSARFLDAALAGADAAAALAAAAGEGDGDSDGDGDGERGDAPLAQILAREILAAGFATIEAPR